MNIPLIIPNFNQKTYLINMINWWNYYTHSAPVYVVDNASTYEPLLSFYDKCKNVFNNVEIIRCEINNCGENLKAFLQEYIHGKYQYYVISNPDIQPHPEVPENFLKIYVEVLNNYSYHRVGLGLIYDDLPDFIDNKADVIKNEKSHWLNKQIVATKQGKYKGYKTGIDLTFCLYKTQNGGWLTNKEGNNFANALRLFKAFHFGWYVGPQTAIDENINYFKTAKTKKNTTDKASIKGVNTYAPSQYKDMIKSAGVYETLALIEKNIAEQAICFYLRFGDGDLLVMDGGNDKFNKHSKELQQKLTEAFQIQQPNYIKGLAVNYPLEKGMQPGLFAPFEYNEKLAGIVKKHSKERNFYNPVVFQYLYVFDKARFDQFFSSLSNRKVIFVGSVQKEVIEKLISNTVFIHIETPSSDSFNEFDRISEELLYALQDLANYELPPLVICACGLTTRALARYLITLGLPFVFLDIGSVVDAAANNPTRKWIKLTQ